MRPFLKKHKYPLLIALIVFLISLLNFAPGKFISGWDTLHPEFDFALNFKRILLGVWCPEQGLGALAGHSHMADLPRVIFLWVIHYVFPLSSLKYLYLCF